MKTITIFCYLVLTVTLVSAQHTSIRLRMGQGWYRMEELRGLHEDFIEMSSPLAVKSTSTFPAHLNTQLQFVNHSPNGRAAGGFVWSHSSTGGRLAYSDHTGELLSDQLLRTEGIGGFFECALPVTSHVFVVPNAQLLMTFTSLEAEEYLSVYGHSSSATAVFNAIGAGMSLGMALRYQRKSWSVEANLGYHLSTAEGFYGVDESAKLVRTANQASVSPQWDGLRLGLTIGKSFGETTSEPLMATEENKHLMMRYQGGLSPCFYVGNDKYRKFKHINILLQEHKDIQLETYIEQYKSNAAGSVVLGIIGGAMVGWPMGNMLGGRKFNHTLFAVGMSTSTVSLILQEVAGYKARKITSRYNELSQY